MLKPDPVALGTAIMQATRERGPYTLQEIADYCGTSHERIRQIVDRALRKIRNRLQCSDPETWEAIRHHIATGGRTHYYKTKIYH